ncbi:hypothetical protein Q4581_21135 [Bacillus thuringiensis]|nr:hypothetical protein [Bacillus thuringiensis]
MIQQVCKQLEVAELADSILIMENKSHIDLLKNRIFDKMDLVIEP